MRKNHLFDNISAAQTEEELKFHFVRFFNLPFHTKNRVDLYTEQILFEFKLNSNLKNIQTRAEVIAQALYYVRRLNFGDDDRTPSENVCIVTKNFAAIFPTTDFADFYTKNTYDWDLKPSSPCKKLVADLSRAEVVIHAHIYDFSNVQEDIAFATLIMNIRKRQASLFNLKKQITDKNFYQVFQHWKKFFGEAVQNGHKASEYFVTDIEQGKSSLVDNNSVIFRLSGGEIREKLINPDEYKYFWNHYEKIASARDIIAIRQKMDRITEINLRRFTGEFYTPIDFAKKAFDYLKRTVGEWWLDKNFRLWDMAAGTGNLEFAIPPEAHKFCYVSTLIKDEADYCANIFPDATVFQYDFLNDNADKLPARLKNDLNNPNIKWIIFINPPYATASNFERDKNRQNKNGVSMTTIRKLMNNENFGEVSRELFSQFIYRISKDFANKIAWLGIFSTLKYITSNNNQKLRDNFFRYKFNGGFMFNSQNFEGCKGKFPVGFLVWNLSENISLEEQKLSLDVYDSDIEKIAEKTFHAERREEFLNKWVKRPRNVKRFPPMVSALTFATTKDLRDRIPENFLGSLMCWNDFTHHDFTAFLSAPYGTAGGMSITPQNFEEYMIIHAVHRIPKLTWLNRNDQFMQPNKELPREFITDAVIWSLFAPSNQTASLRDVEYEGEVYQIRNNFYPFLLSEVQSWSCSSISIAAQLAMAQEDRFAASWIKANRADLSSEAISVLNAGREIYKRFYAELARLDVRKWKIDNWDAGWYQVRMSLDAKLSLEELSNKLEPQIYELGFLRDEVRYFT